MDDLELRLQNIKEAGAYRLNCSVDGLRAAAAQTDFTLFEADVAAVQSKGEFLAVIAQAIHAPEWFGHNWDALADALGDLSWQPAPGYVLLLHNGGETLGLSAADHTIATEILTDTVNFWRSQGRPLWVFFC